MTIADKLALLEQTKEAQRVKLGIPENTPFSQYVKFIRNPFTPAELFANSEQGVWLDPSDLSTMFQDIKGRTPVTRDGHPVGLFLDKSQGLHLKDVTSLVNLITAGGVTSEPTEQGTRYTVGESVGGVTIRDTDPLKTYKVEMTYSLEGTASWHVKEALEEGENKKVEFISGPEDYGYRLYIRGSNFNITIHSLEVFEITGNHATQSVSASRPIYRTDGELHWLEFDGVDDYLSVSNGALINNTISIAFEYYDNSESLAFADGNTLYWGYAGPNPIYLNLKELGLYNLGLPRTRPVKLLLGMYSSSDDLQRMFVNGETRDPIRSWDASASNPLTIGTRPNGSRPLTGAMYSFILSDKKMLESDIEVLERYTSNKAGVMI